MDGIRIIAFVNPGAGDYEGVRVLELLKNQIGDENVFNIIADKGPDRGLDERASDPTIDVRIVVAGGDGTFSWVANAVEKKSFKHCRLIVIPLGSGNDMARALGWGKKFPGLAKIPDYLDWMHNAKPHSLDVWRLKAVENPALASTEDDGVPHEARPLVCNYLSLGADAFVELRFNMLRWKNPDKYKSRLGNFKAHALVGAKYVCSAPSKKIHVADHIESLHIDGKLIEIPEKLQAIIFLNIPSYAAGTQPWGFPGAKKQADLGQGTIVNDMYVDDHKFEVIGLRSLTHFGLIKLFKSHGVRIAQGYCMSLKLKSDSTPFQVDGEPWVQRGGEVTLEPGNPVGVLEGPVWKGSSKKNAKFDPNSPHDDDDDDDGDNEENAADAADVADAA